MKKSDLEKVGPYIQMRMREIDEERKKNRKDTVIDLFREELLNLGFNFDPVFETAIICESNSMLTRDLVRKYYHLAKNINEKSFFVSCLVPKDNEDMQPTLISDFISIDDIHFRSTVGLFLSENPILKYKENYLEILQNEKINAGQIFIIDCLFKLNAPELRDVLIKTINNDRLVEYSLKTLAKYKDPELIEYFERYLTHKDSDIRRIAKKAIEKLDVIKEKTRTK